MSEAQAWSLLFHLRETKDLRLLDALRRHPSYELRGAVGCNPAATSAMLIELASDENVEVRKHVASNPSCPQEAVDLLLCDPVLAVQRGLAWNPSVPVSKLREWAAYWPKTDAAMAKNPACPEDVMARLAESGDHDVCVGLLENPSTPIGLIEGMATSDDDTVRGLVACADRTPLRTILKLVRDDEYEVRYAALGHWLCPVSFLVEAAEEKVFEAWVVVARNPRTPANILARLADYDYEPGEYAADPDPDWGPETAFRDVLEALASNPMLPDNVYRKLATHQDEGITALIKKLPALAISGSRDETEISASSYWFTDAIYEREQTARFERESKQITPPIK
jgi:hypothetical protein